jgi:hypothetical protein
MPTRPKREKIALAALEAAVDGFEFMLAIQTYHRILINEGLPGISRKVRENRQHDLQTWFHSAERSKHIEAERIGNHLRITLTDSGWSQLSKLRIRAARTLPRGETVLVTFDFPMSQKKARDVFRYFLKSCGFKKMQQSLWRTRRDVAAPLKEFVERSGSQAWIRIFHATER